LALNNIAAQMLYDRDPNKSEPTAPTWFIFSPAIETIVAGLLAEACLRAYSSLPMS